MDLQLTGLRALVTGGTRGIGRTIVESLTGEGAAVAFCARDESEVASTVTSLERSGARVIGTVLDVKDGPALASWVNDTAEVLGGLDIVVPNVSALAIGPDEDTWRASFEVDLLHTVRVVAAAMPHLERSGNGSIVVVSSVSGREIDFAASSYGTMKAALIHYTQGIAFQQAGNGIRANSVSPGNVYFTGGIWNTVRDSNPELYASALALNPTGRMARPEEVAYAVTMLASPLASFINGANLVVDGALTRGGAALNRRLPRWSELRPLLQPAPLVLNPVARRLGRAATITDLRSLALRRAPRAVFDYTDGAAEAELSLHRAREAFRRVEFVPRVLHDVSGVDTATTMLGARSALPLALAPTGFTRMMHAEGESAVARVAQHAGIPYGLSTMGTTSIEALAAAAPDVRRWFQLYLWRDREASAELVNRAAAAGYEAMMLTVDTPVAGARLRDVHNGLTIPPRLRLKTFLDGAMHPAWWFDLLTTEPLHFATLSSWQGTVADLINNMFDPALTLDDLTWLRERWPGPLLVKGILGAEDAIAVLDRGADAVVVSNHGGRQLDRAPTPLEQLPAVVDAVGDRAEVYLDGGVLSGADVVAAVAMGARGCLIGRAYLYGLMAGGERGVARAVEILDAEIRRTMQLVGVSAVDQLGRQHVRLRA